MLEYFIEKNEQWNKFVETSSDQRIKDWMFMDTWVPSALVCILYVVFCVVGPRLMRDRKAYDLKNFMVAYNLFAFTTSGYIFYEYMMSGWLFDYSLGCQPVDYSNSPTAMRMARTCWLFLITKFIDLLDTVFFILRKKNNQVTFLHVFHHAIMPISGWFAMKFVAGGFGSFGCCLNAFIHCVMYFYYFLTAFGDRFRKYLWWKKYMTMMQMSQFVIILIHASQLLFIECDYPIFFVYWSGSLVFFFLIFFINFYVHERRRQSRARAAKKTNAVKKDE